MFILSKSYVYCIYLDDSNRKKEVNMNKKDVKIRQFLDSAGFCFKISEVRLGYPPINRGESHSLIYHHHSSHSLFGSVH